MNVPPPAQGMTPQQYYSFLTQQGIPGWAAYDAVTANFGTPEQAQAKYNEDVQKSQEPSTGYQIGQVAGVVGGSLVGREILTGGENVRGWFKVKQPDGTVQDVEVPAVQTNETGQPLPVATENNPLIASKPTIVGTSKDGGALMSDGSTIAADGTITTTDGTKILDNGSVIEANETTGSNYSDYLQYAGYALAAYNVYKALSDKNASDKDKAIASTQAGLGAAQTYNASVGGSYGGYLAVAQGAIGAYQAGTMKNASDEQKTRAVAHQIGMAVANYYTFGLAGLADSFARSQWGGTMSKVDKWMWEDKYGKYLAGTAGLTAMSKLWTSDKWKTEGNRLRKLQEQGVEIPEGFSLPTILPRGRTKDELVRKDLPEDFVGFSPEGEWVNNKFARSRDVKDLKGTDIVGYSAWFEKYGNDWMKLKPEQREQIAQTALSNNAVKEHSGTIDIQWSPQLEEQINKISPLGVGTGPEANKMGKYKPGQNIETLASAAGKPTPSTAIAKQPTSQQPGTSSNQQSATQNLQSLTQPPRMSTAIQGDGQKQWSKEAMQRELARRLERKRR